VDLTSSRATRVAVCVVSYRRPEGLARLLGALDALEPAAGVRQSVVVVDNDPQESARPVCAAVRERVSYPLTYAVEKRRGIPQARNRALALALQDADFVAFIDDDEVPDAAWLAQLLRVQHRCEADAVAGPCLPRFLEPPPDWIARGGFFERPRFATGERLEVAYTHNVLVSAAALGQMEAFFDERMALCGGSDVEFFRRFAHRGHRIVWSDGAVTRELVPPTRATLRWVLRRALRVGASTTRVRRLHAPGMAGVLQLLVHGSYCLIKGCALLLAAPLRGRAATARALALACFGVGRLGGLLGLQVDEYRRTHGR
jgi:succinoglycan biosynthesis protein ExoM